MPLAHAEIDGDGVHVGARQPVGGFEDESRAIGAHVHRREAFGDGALENCTRIEQVTCFGESIAEPSRGGFAPQILEGDDAPDDGGGGHAKHRLLRTEVETRHHDPLATPDELSMRPLSSAERMHVEASPCRRSEANGEMNLRARNRDALHVAFVLVEQQRRHGAAHAASMHEEILVRERASSKLRRALVRFFQSGASADGYGRLMNILVTGATGKVGSRLSKRLTQRDHHVRALVRDPARAADLREAGIELATGNLLEPDSLAAAVRGVDAVVHCAAFFRGATAEQAHAVNDLGTQHLALAARAASVKRFVFTSTGLVYGSNGGRLAREDDACAPTAAYPVSKLAAERYLLGLEGLDVRVLRLPFVYGDGDPHIDEVVPHMRSFPPTHRMSIAHHVDVAQAAARLLDAPSPAHRIYNVVDDEAPDLATLVASVGAPPPDGSDPERARTFDALLDGRRIREDLGFEPRFPRLADAIAAGA